MKKVFCLMAMVLLCPALCIALELDGRSQYVGIDSEAVRITGAPISVQAWVQSESMMGIIFESGAANRNPGPQAGYALYMKWGRLRFTVNKVTSGWDPMLWDDVTTKAAYNDGKWHHVTGVFPADGKTRVSIYVDGREVTEVSRAGKAHAAVSSYTETTPVARIGAQTDRIMPYINFWRGEIRNVRVWRVALTAEQVAADYRDPVDAATPGLVAGWLCDGTFALGGEVADRAGSHHGVMSEEKLDIPPLANDPSKYPGGLTGWTGFDTNQVVRWTLKGAVRTRIGTRGGRRLALVPGSGGQIIAFREASDGGAAFFESKDLGRTWTASSPLDVGADVFRKPAVAGLSPVQLIKAVNVGGKGSPKDRSGDHVVLTESNDGGATWGEPRALLGESNTHADLLKLDDGRLLCTYVQLRLPFGVYGVLSNDKGKTWDHQRPIFLARSWDGEMGPPTSIQLDDGTLLTAYSIRAYLEGDPAGDTVTEVVRWQLPRTAGDEDAIVGVVSDHKMNAEAPDWGKYPAHLSGLSGVNRQEVAYQEILPAERTRVGHPGYYKGGLAKFPNGDLLATPSYRLSVMAHRSRDGGRSWKFLGAPGFAGKEQGLTCLRDGTILQQGGRMLYRSTDRGDSWAPVDLLSDRDDIKSIGLTRDIVEYDDGTLVMMKAHGSWYKPNDPPSKAWRFLSRDGGKTWPDVREVPVWKDPLSMFSEAALVKLPDGTLLASGRIDGNGIRPGGAAPPDGSPTPSGSEAADTMMLTESKDMGLTWSAPREFLGYSRVHAHLLVLADGRLLCSYASYHLPFGVFAVLSEDNGRTWDHEHPIQLAFSQGCWTGWPTSVQLDDGTIVTMNAIATHLGENDKNHRTSADVVRWRPPAKQR